ncbi:MAG: Tol-Pal system beta propeller repeat protein TolB [Deltaproteobacteria bacterium HGW-Deltaproteobacteria-10]|nr:MAG: Tol-Pal system beta propeller repeat protein TolB [Deltaproteobacteria bacterium HGW-Deltaproteobacteria-10]
MRKYFLSMLVAVLILGSLFVNSAFAAKVYIDVDSPNFQLFPIAVCDFDITDPNTAAKFKDSGVALADEVKRYLIMTGFFNPLNKKSFLDDKIVDSPAATIAFANWVMIGADYLVKGYFAQSEKETIAECRLFDVIKGDLLLNKKYIRAGNDLKALAKNIASDILFELTGDEGDFNTQIAFVAKKGNKADIYTVNYDGSEMKALTNHRAIIISPRWSPDGRYLAFTSFKGGDPEVYIRDLKNGLERKVASFEGLNLCGYWSPDGRKILLTLSKDGNEELYALEVESMKLQRLTNNYAIDVSPVWSPDGKKIAFVSNRGGTPQVYTMDADGNNVKRITFEGNYNTSPSWSPRGGRIAYEGLINKKFQIFTIDEEGNNLLQLTFDAADNESPSWSPSGRQIAYSSKTNSKSKICIMNANGLNGRVLKENSGTVAMPMWSPRWK